jgi:hypothetical protein
VKKVDSEWENFSSKRNLNTRRAKIKINRCVTVVNIGIVGGGQ